MSVMKTNYISGSIAGPTTGKPRDSRLRIFFKKVAQVAASAEEITKAIHVYGEKWRDINN